MFHNDEKKCNPFNKHQDYDYFHHIVCNLKHLTNENTSLSKMKCWNLKINAPNNIVIYKDWQSCKKFGFTCWSWNDLEFHIITSFFLMIYIFFPIDLLDYNIKDFFYLKKI
jgi:hypothetical protein